MAGYVTIKGSLAVPLRRAQRQLPVEYRLFMGVMRDRFVNRVKEHTPTETTRLRDSIEGTDIVQLPYQAGYSTRVRTDVPYASFVEEDTRPHKIRPRDPHGKLVFTGHDGRKVVTSEVDHPGTTGQHMFAKGAADIEAEAPARMEVTLEEWIHRSGL